MVSLFEMICRVHQEMPESDLKTDLEETLIKQVNVYPETVREFLMFLDSNISQAIKDIRFSEVKNLVDKYNS